ncbi:ADP-ribosylglycohydrolase family protein [Flavobacterium cheonanense]|uniref:ADP-ribosylglycohydrolase family protein n=1 Tax=Flavobacterium cheonanense TaxID=706183 RepID=A0ABP7VVI2_9FLAO
MNIESNKVIDCLLGVAVGDALGVPFEFKRTFEMIENPATEMTEYGTHHQPVGTWSDDSSLTFCLAESLADNYDLADMAKKFINWRDNNYWTANGEVFDIGITTNNAISELEEIVDYKNYEKLKALKNQASELDNGNGSLMRILPLLFYIKKKGIKEQFEIIWEASALTHKHIRAAMSCFIYLKLAEYLLNGEEKELAYTTMKADVLQLWDDIKFDKLEQQHFKRIIQNHILETKREDLKSGGYVIESLEASLWCFMNESDYKNALLSVINLGHDTDTTGAITGGLAGLYYGISNIPENWIKVIKRLNDIVELGNKLNNKCMA